MASPSFVALWTVEFSRKTLWSPMTVRAPMVVLDGNTGSAKTEILKLLPAHGLQVIDLEGLANHRGSLFGAMGPQPSQKAFEGRLAQALAAHDTPAYQTALKELDGGAVERDLRIVEGIA